MGSRSMLCVVQQEAVALLESRSSEDGISEESISALHSIEEQQDTQESEEETPEDAAKALLGLPDIHSGMTLAKNQGHVDVSAADSASSPKKASAPLPAVQEEEDGEKLPEAETRFQSGSLRAFRRSASSQGPRAAKKGNSFSHDAQSARFHPHGWSRRSTHGKAVKPQDSPALV